MGKLGNVQKVSKPVFVSCAMSLEYMQYIQRPIYCFRFVIQLMSWLLPVFDLYSMRHSKATGDTVLDYITVLDCC